MPPATKQQGQVYRVSGPVVTATGINPRMYDIVRVGTERLMGEVIEIDGEKSIIQVYEDTSGIRPGEPVENTGLPLSVELGPGLLTSIYDGIQRPLEDLQKEMGDFIKRGVDVPGLDHDKKWEFKPTAKPGDRVHGGAILGTVQETKSIQHRVMVPPNVKETTVKTLNAGAFTIDQVIGTLADGTELRMMHKWPVRSPRPFKEKLLPDVPLNTGQRILDGLFPLAKGGTAAIPGPFGSGKCVAGDTPVLLGDGRLVPIEELYRANAQTDAAQRGDEHLQPLASPLYVIGFDGAKLSSVEATQIYRGTTDAMVRLKTRTGRELLVTPAHKLFRVQDARIEEVPAGELGEGDFLAAPRRISLGKDGAHHPFPVDPLLRCADPDTLEEFRNVLRELPGTRQQVAQRLEVSPHDVTNWLRGPNAPRWEIVTRVFHAARRQPPAPTLLRAERDSRVVRIPPIVDEEVAEFLGLYLSEGTTKSGQVVVFYNNDDELLARYGELAERLFGLRPTVRQERTVKAASINSRALARLLGALGIPALQKSRTISVPAQVMAGPETVVRAFLRAYIEGDGAVMPRGLEIATASRRMATGILYLFARLGAIGRLGRRTINGRTYYRVFASPKQVTGLLPEAYAPDAPRFDSFDVVPLGAETLTAILRDAGYANLKRDGVEIHNYLAGGERLTRATMAKLVRHAPQLATFAQALEDVFCDEIVEHEVILGRRPVFDLVVPATENFVGGHAPSLLHNTVTQQQLAKWSDAQIVVYIGCGERGNEMTEVLTEFPHLTDPKSGNPLMDRTVLIANTSNMPVAAREASVYTGITIAEYYRDMGYDVSLMADSTSRWAEAMREISSRLEEMPGEEGYPAYLAARLSEFYERAGRIITLNKQEGSVSVIGAVSPPGGDFSEPVTQNTLRIVKVFWALDAKLAQRRHFPAINWLQSYSLYNNSLAKWYTENVAADWNDLRAHLMELLQKEAELSDIVQLVGSDALPEPEQLTLEVARMIREFFLQQNAYHDVDTYASLKKQYKMIQSILLFEANAKRALQAGATVRDIAKVQGKDDLARSKFEKNFDEIIDGINKKLGENLDRLSKPQMEAMAQ